MIDAAEELQNFGVANEDASARGGAQSRAERQGCGEHERARRCDCQNGDGAHHRGGNIHVAAKPA